MKQHSSNSHRPQSSLGANFALPTQPSSARRFDPALFGGRPARPFDFAGAPLAPLAAPHAGNGDGKTQSSPDASSALPTSGQGCRFPTRFSSRWIPSAALPRPRQIGVAGTIDGVPVRVFEARLAWDLDESVLSNRIPVRGRRRRPDAEE